MDPYIHHPNFGAVFGVNSDQKFVLEGLPEDLRIPFGGQNSMVPNL